MHTVVDLCSVLSFLKRLILSQIPLLHPKSILSSCVCKVAWFGFCFIPFIGDQERHTHLFCHLHFFLFSVSRTFVLSVDLGVVSLSTSLHLCVKWRDVWGGQKEYI